MPNLKHKLSIKYISLIAIILFGTVNHAYSLPAEMYATTSVLSSGNWAKVEVKETGMQFISDAVIKGLGFSDPDKVNVYGYGGILIPENLNSPDDLPLLPSIRVNGGIVFWGLGYVGWGLKKSGNKIYAHQSHPYSDHSYYFISDVAPARQQVSQAEQIKAEGEPLKSFIQRLVHEQDLTMPMNTGRLILGEDFRSVTSRSFTFSLPGNIGSAFVKTVFGSKSGSGTNSIVLSANGKQLEATTDDRMPYSSSKEVVLAETVKEVKDAGEKLDLSIKFNGSGNVTIAGLDYIEVEYPQELRLTGNELYFYLNPDAPRVVELEGAGQTTRVWDVTDAQNPMEVKTNLSGTTLTFNTESGYHEYVAFDPAKVSRAVSALEKVSNQDLHSLEAPDMLIISPTEYLSASRRIEDLHRKTDGLKVTILTPEEIYNEFSSGKADVTAFRKLLKMWYDRAEGEEGKYPAYCLIMSRPTYDNKMVTALVRNAGYPRIPIWQTATGETETASYSTDDYIGMLGDVKGNFNMGTSEIHVAVGRMPVKNLNEANTVIDKLEEYMLNPDLGSWRNNVMIIADDQDNGTHLEQAESVVEALKNNGKGNSFLYEKLYLDAYKMESSAVGNIYPTAKARMFNKWNEGTAYINYIGHANPKGWGHESMLTWPDIISMSNTRLPFIYAATCEFMRWDADDISGAEILWSLPNSGVIGMICPSREVLISANGILNRSTAEFVFQTDEKGQPLSIGEVMRRGKNASNTGTNKLRYGLIGDPSMKLPWPDLNAKVTTINGMDLSETEELPVLSARSTATISGHIEDYQGLKIEDFNGIAEVALYDAEKVMTTNGNGSNGVVAEYNDRKTRLFVGRTKVIDGEWSITFTMPSEIDNNYSPAFVSIYASDDKKREANGHTTDLYAYGYDVTAPDDFDGPKIIEFYLNSPSFVSGNEVSPNPTLTAVFYDESGISVSEAGIGHNITLDLDGKTYYEDVAQYFLPDETDSGRGSLVYPLGEIEQGRHTLRFTVWDNANNSTTASLDFNISALWKPTIQTLTTDVNPAVSDVNFIIGTDGTSGTMECSIEVYDIWGKRMWREIAPSLSGIKTRTTLNWNLCDFSGSRVPSGIYLYRATVKMDNGATVAKTKKLIVR